MGGRVRVGRNRRRWAGGVRPTPWGAARDVALPCFPRGAQALVRLQTPAPPAHMDMSALNEVLVRAKVSGKGPLQAGGRDGR